jgi:hypothetical protein
MNSDILCEVLRLLALVRLDSSALLRSWLLEQGWTA